MERNKMCLRETVRRLEAVRQLGVSQGEKVVDLGDLCLDSLSQGIDDMFFARQQEQAIKYLSKRSAC